MRRPRSTLMSVAISLAPGPLSSNVEALARRVGALRRAPRRRLPAPRPATGGGVATARLLVDARLRRALRRVGASVPGAAGSLGRARHRPRSHPAVPREPRRVDAAMAAGELYRRAGHHADAAARFARAYAAGGGPEALWQNAQALFAAGDHDAAEQTLTLWATLVPDGMEKLKEARAQLGKE